MTPRADVLIVNARLWTDDAPVAGADALAVGAGMVLATGRAADLEPLTDARTERIDAAGATVTPGFTDAHLHLVAWAGSRSEIALLGAASAAACVQRVSDAIAAQSGAGTIVGRGWDAEDWPVPPHRALLDAIAPHRPVLLHSRDYHALWVNSAALAAAGVGHATPDPAGGRFERDIAGVLTGIVREHAVRAFSDLGAERSPDRLAQQLADAARELHAMGITAVHDFEGDAAFHALRALTRAQGPRLRVLMHLTHAGLDHARALGLESGVGDAWFRIGAIKLFADGTLGSRTAAMLAPYEGTDETGMDLLSRDELRDIVRRALEGGLALAVHAIGDRAVRHTLDAFETSRSLLPGSAMRSRIEHMQLVAPPDIERLARMGIVASMQPVHCTSDITLAERHWGARRAHAYPWRAFEAAGATLVFGSDAPVEPPDAAAGLHAAVTRQRPDGTPPGGWMPEQRVTLDRALAAWTHAPAALAGASDTYGSLRAGGRADLVVWDRDLHRSAAAELFSARPVFTLLDGAIVHRGVVASRTVRA